MYKQYCRCKKKKKKKWPFWLFQVFLMKFVRILSAWVKIMSEVKIPNWFQSLLLAQLALCHRLNSHWFCTTVHQLRACPLLVLTPNQFGLRDHFIWSFKWTAPRWWFWRKHTAAVDWQAELRHWINLLAITTKCSSLIIAECGLVS